MSWLRFLQEGRAVYSGRNPWAHVQSHHKTGWLVSVASSANGRGFTQLMFCCGSRAKQMAWDKQGGGGFEWPRPPSGSWRRRRVRRWPSPRKGRQLGPSAHGRDAPSDGTPAQTNQSTDARKLLRLKPGQPGPPPFPRATWHSGTSGPRENTPILLTHSVYMKPLGAWTHSVSGSLLVGAEAREAGPKSGSDLRHWPSSAKPGGLSLPPRQPVLGTWPGLRAGQGVGVPREPGSPRSCRDLGSQLAQAPFQWGSLKLSVCLPFPRSSLSQPPA